MRSARPAAAPAPQNRPARQEERCDREQQEKRFAVDSAEEERGGRDCEEQDGALRRLLPQPRRGQAVESENAAPPASGEDDAGKDVVAPEDRPSPAISSGYSGKNAGVLDGQE